MVKPLSFKGDKKLKKRKRVKAEEEDIDNDNNGATSRALTTTTTAAETGAGADAAEEEDDDSWVTAEAATDLAGPVIVVLPTDPPTCIACDANGQVFALEVENVVDGNGATAEPHDVRQVWIANRVAGTECVSLKGHHGRYLTVDKFGLLSATREAISEEEQYNCIPNADTPGTFGVQTQREKFLSVDTDSKQKSGSQGPEIRGDAESLSFETAFRIRMQARFKPRLKASKETRAREKISRKELEAAVGRRLDEDEVRRLKRARREGDYHEAILDVRVSGKHDKFAS